MCRHSRFPGVVALFLLIAPVACSDDSESTDPTGVDASAEEGVGDDSEEPAADAESNEDSDSGSESVDTQSDSDSTIEHGPESAIYDYANQCVSLGLQMDDGAPVSWLRATDDGQGYEFGGSEAEASRFFMRASDLGIFLFYDEDEGYIVAEGGPVERWTQLESDITKVDDSYISGAEWIVEFSELQSFRYQLRNRRSGTFWTADGLSPDEKEALPILIEAADGCTEHPELTLDAEGEVQKTTYDDGELFGFVDTHSHILSNFGFGGGGVFHGAPFHRLGPEHALGSCEPFHKEDGRADFMSFGFAEGAGESLDPNVFLDMLATGLLPEANHNTDGWPTFTQWPSADTYTHQTQYYIWLERAWMAGLRLMVQHAVSNEALCQLMTDTGFQPARYGCEDMLNIDRQLEEIRRMERYIDAQSGGPGEGWFRIVGSPEEARDVIEEGKLAIVLGIEVPNLFDCYLTQRPGGPECNDAHIESQLDHYYEQGVRVLFPNHKYDNAFTPGDGDRGIFEIGTFLQSGHWSNYVQDCPQVSVNFDKGPVVFGGLNMPRDEYLSRPPNELVQLSETPLLDLLPYYDVIIEGSSLEGEWCQKAGLTEKGVTLIEGIMDRGILVELDHLPKRSYLDVYEMLKEAGYPALGTHGNNQNGDLYPDLGGMSKTGFSRCANPDDPGSMAGNFRSRGALREASGLHPSEGFGFDLNGLAGVPGPRFGPKSKCGQPQMDPVEYPFESYGGGVTFSEPRMGEREIDFNTEGMIHIGLVPELIEDARRTGVTDEDLDLLFRSAEGYIRTWERAETVASRRR